MAAIRLSPAVDFIGWVTGLPDDGIVYGVVKQTATGILVFVASFPAEYDPRSIMAEFRLEPGEAMVCFRKQDDGNIVPVAKRKAEKPNSGGYASLY